MDLKCETKNWSKIMIEIYVKINDRYEEKENTKYLGLFIITRL